MGIDKNRTNDGRKYEVGDKVTFTDDDGKQVPGVIHGVRYQQGRAELVGADHEDPNDPNSPIVPGTGQMEMIKGTEDERHSFEYLVVHEHEHEAWQKTEKENQLKLAEHEANVKKHRGSVKPHDPDHPDNFHKLPPHKPLKDHPPLKQHLRVFEED